MTLMIEDGVGSGSRARVDTNRRIHTHSVVEAEEVHQAELGRSWNINSKWLSYSAAGTMVYLKNNETNDLVISAIALSAGTGSTSDIGDVTVVLNPTGGDLISDATAISINANRRAGDDTALSADVYAGKSGGTLTGGTETLFFGLNTSSRLFGTINLLLPKGGSIGVKYEPQLSSGTIKAYCALIVHLKNPNSKDVA